MLVLKRYRLRLRRWLPLDTADLVVSASNSNHAPRPLRHVQLLHYRKIIRLRQRHRFRLRVPRMLLRAPELLPKYAIQPHSTALSDCRLLYHSRDGIHSSVNPDRPLHTHLLPAANASWLPHSAPLDLLLSIEARRRGR